MKTREAQKLKRQVRTLAYSLVFALITIAIEYAVRGGHDLSLGLWEFWNFHGSLVDVAKITAWWIGEGLLLSTLIVLYRRKRQVGTLTFSKVVLISGVAGTLEEITFRWLFFYSAMSWAVWIDPWGFEQWIYGHLELPIANFVLVGQFDPGWVIGIAMLVTAKTFSEGHAYQGPLGVAWSWISGLFLYRIMFQHGIVAAMLAHFIYDLIVLEYGRRLQQWRCSALLFPSLFTNSSFCSRFEMLRDVPGKFGVTHRFRQNNHRAFFSIFPALDPPNLWKRDKCNYIIAKRVIYPM